MTDILAKMRANASINVSTENNKAVISKEETDVIINIDQAHTPDGAIVDSAGTVEDTLAAAADAQAVVDSQTPNIAQGANDIAGLESVRVLLGRHRKENGGVDMQAAPVLATTVNNCLRGIGLDALAINMPATEAFGGSQSAFDATRTSEEKIRSTLNARRLVNLESMQLQAEDRGTANESYVEAAEAIIERAAGLERVVANMSGEPSTGEIEVGDLAKTIGSKNGSVPVAAANLAAFVSNSLGANALAYNNLGCAMAEVTPTEGSADLPPATPAIDAASGGDVTITGTDGADNVTVTVDGEPGADTNPAPAEVGADNTPATEPAAVEPEPTKDPEEGETKPSTEDGTVDKDLLVDDNGKQTTVAKPEDQDNSTSDSVKEAGEGTQIATELPGSPSTESDDPSVSDIVENLQTDADLPGDAVIQAEDDVIISDDEDADLGEVAQALNTAEVNVDGGNYAGGGTLPALDQAGAMLILKSVREIATSVVNYAPIAAARDQILDGTHQQLEEVASGELSVEAADAIGTATDVSTALYRTVSDAECAIGDHALNACRDLLTYVSLSCKAYTDVPAVEEKAPVVDPAPTDPTNTAPEPAPAAV